MLSIPVLHYIIYNVNGKVEKRRERLPAIPKKKIAKNYELTMHRSPRFWQRCTTDVMLAGQPAREPGEKTSKKTSKGKCRETMALRNA